MLNKITSILFYASDLKKSVEFYQALGFPAQLSGDTAHVKLDNITLDFIDENKTPIKNESGIKPKGTGVFTYVEVENVDEYYKALVEKGIRPSSEPRDWPWGNREFAVKDPDGYKLIFFSEVSN